MRLLHFFCVDKVRLGRKLGIGTRLAAKVLSGQARKPASSNGVDPFVSAKERRTEPARTQVPAGSGAAARRGAVAGNVVRKAARGGRGFGQRFWGPFVHAGRALWYEVTGVFFALFAAFFLQGLWRLRGAWRSGPEHQHFYIYVILAVVFIYFSVSAFVRARHIQH